MTFGFILLNPIIPSSSFSLPYYWFAIWSIY